MSLETFLHNLHFDIEKVSPPDWKVDWEDAPLKYKLYQGRPETPLTLEVPLKLEGQEEQIEPNLQKIGHFLWYIYGITQYSESAFSSDSAKQSVELMQSYRRFVPSGGALYPSELYVYLKIKDLPAGVYHYDAAHHRLILLREGNFDSYITKALGDRCAMSACFGTVIVSTMFWKNFFKYNNFSYRLQGLDAGVLIGQLLEVGNRFGIESEVYFQFLDRAINHLLGLSEEEESVYAVIPLSVEPANLDKNRSRVDRIVYADELCRELPAIQYDYYVRSQRVREYPMLTKINKASMLESTQSFRQISSKESMEECDEDFIALPQAKRLSYDLASVCQNRYSPSLDFVMGKVSQLEVASLFQEATSALLYHSDLDGANKKHMARVSLFGCLTNVDGIKDGAYEYKSANHALQQVNLADHRPQLQYGLSAGNINLFQTPLSLHVAGNLDYFKTELGIRGYRIQQMEVGILVQRLLLAASAIGMGGHPLLGFDANICDDIYKMRTNGKTSLIHIPIGPYRPRAWLRGNLLS
ncbi:SagB family peptide dehydrogenase [Cytobacillus purgationiresistens]|uniref:SagB-type dehydrogenase family enzyme n=1 Tax=Cytobacillus purgationiresistens TaxID=863449 RepID=A0ABU0ACZ9_9BACI|nr:SagB family peptide dehydrogenase [Cytobacillus purgationiresistens]MDQ0268596.1 SagB-type dehydrogenase family enzyme [Cytobacillus purgationiresistens]